MPGRQGRRRFESAMLHRVLNLELALAGSECQSADHLTTNLTTCSARIGGQAWRDLASVDLRTFEMFATAPSTAWMTTNPDPGLDFAPDERRRSSGADRLANQALRGLCRKEERDRRDRLRLLAV